MADETLSKQPRKRAKYSRTRRTMENAFDILSACWRIFHLPIKQTLGC